MTDRLRVSRLSMQVRLSCPRRLGFESGMQSLDPCPGCLRGRKISVPAGQQIQHLGCYRMRIHVEVSTGH